MQTVLLKITSSIFLTGLILSLPLSVPAKSDKEFPYHIDKTVEKQKIYNYPFEEVWETALTALKEIENIHLRNFREQGLISAKSIIKSDRSTGLMTLNLTHKGKKGIFSEKESLFLYTVLFLKPLDSQRTSVVSHVTSFMSYDRYIFHGDQLARYLDMTPPARNVLEEINTHLKGKDVESQ